MATGLHEEFSRDTRSRRRATSASASWSAAILLAFGCLRAWLHGEVGWFSGVLGGIGLVLIAAALIKPDVLEPANRGWNKLGLVLHKVTNPIFLGAMYAIAIVPTGLMMRVVRRRSDGPAAAARGHLLDQRAARAARPRSRWKSRSEVTMSFLKDMAAFMLARKKFWLCRRWC